jgi:hypothetical protein
MAVIGCAQQPAAMAVAPDIAGVEASRKVGSVAYNRY